MLSTPQVEQLLRGTASAAQQSCTRQLATFGAVPERQQTSPHRHDLWTSGWAHAQVELGSCVMEAYSIVLQGSSARMLLDLFSEARRAVCHVQCFLRRPRSARAGWRASWTQLFLLRRPAAVAAQGWRQARSFRGMAQANSKSESAVLCTDGRSDCLFFSVLCRKHDP